MNQEKSGFRKFWESKTGYACGALMLLSVSYNIWETLKTDPSNFPDVEDRFRILRDTDLDGVRKLTVYRNDVSALSVFDSDLIALERKIGTECGQMSKFYGPVDSGGKVPVNFRLLRPPYNCRYLD
jgi:hypothetical protein